MVRKLAELYGSMVFDEKTMRSHLSPESFGAWKQCVTDGKTLDPHTAGEIAEAMKLGENERLLYIQTVGR